MGDIMSKYKAWVFSIFLLSILSIGYVHAENNYGLKNKIIYLDPGHGGADPGTVYKEIHEADLNLKIAEKLKNKLEAEGATVYMTRYGDYDLSVPYAENRKRSDLSRRGNIINRSNCDLYLSIHLNSGASTTWKGAQVFYDDTNEQNEEIARIMQEELSKSLNSNKKYKLTSEMYLHKRIKQPGVLIEVGFLSNPNERYLLQQDSYQEKATDAILNGLKRYFEIKGTG